MFEKQKFWLYNLLGIVKQGQLRRMHRSTCIRLGVNSCLCNYVDKEFLVMSPVKFYINAFPYGPVSCFECFFPSTGEIVSIPRYLLKDNSALVSL